MRGLESRTHSVSYLSYMGKFVTIPLSILYWQLHEALFQSIGIFADHSRRDQLKRSFKKRSTALATTTSQWNPE